MLSLPFKISALLVACGVASALAADEPDLILHHGKVVTVDSAFSIREAIAVSGNKIIAVGEEQPILALATPKTKVIDLGGKMLMPGLIDSHAHPPAAMTEFDHPVPDMETIQDVLDYIRSRATVAKEGDWVQVSQVFITRLREQRYPTRAELDAAGQGHPVIFSTGPDASLNTLALKLSGIDKDFKVTDGGGGFAEKDAETGEPTGILRNCTRFVKVKSGDKTPSEDDYYKRTLELFKDYNSVGLTSIGDRDTYGPAIVQYEQMLEKGDLTLRVAISHHIDTIGLIEDVQRQIRRVAAHPLRRPNPMLRIIGIKTYLDGGMLTGSAYMREPWGVSKMYGITDPNYKGVLFIPKERLLPIVKTTIEAGLQYTAHSVGDGAVHTLIGVYDELSREMPIKQVRPCVTHANFESPEDIQTAARLGVVFDIQPAWLYLDTRTLEKQFGYDRLRWFQPLHTLFEAGVIVGGGSDHMQKIGSFRSINPYNPFLGMATAITRKAKWYDKQLHPEEALTRQQAIRFYTWNNAYLLFLDDQVGSLEAGKLADFIVLDTDLLTCPEDAIKNTQVLQTYMDGKLVFSRN